MIILSPLVRELPQCILEIGAFDIRDPQEVLNTQDFYCGGKGKVHSRSPPDHTQLACDAISSNPLRANMALIAIISPT
jgi:hypothetical protein